MATRIYAQSCDGEWWMEMTPGATDERRTAFKAANPGVTEDDLDALFDVYVNLCAVTLEDDDDLAEVIDDRRGQLLGRLYVDEDGVPCLEAYDG
jgi:hypothetical protein